MTNINSALDALEAVCDDKMALVTYHLPELNQIVETIKFLPHDQQQEYLGRLERISMILEGQMLALAEELEVLRKQIPAVQNSNAGTFAYRKIAAVIPVKPTDSEK
jgi:hypothetical protein